jgi:hypothetical protein
MESGKRAEKELKMRLTVHLVTLLLSSQFEPRRKLNSTTTGTPPSPTIFVLNN